MDEVPLVVVRAGGAPAESNQPEFQLPPLDLESWPLSRRIGRDSLLLSTHREADLPRPIAEPVWRSPHISGQEEIISLPPLPSSGGPALQEVINHRQSSRRFGAKNLSLAQLGALLGAALAQPAPVMASIIIGSGAQLTAGSYLYLPDRHALLVRASGQDWRRVTAEACLGQNFMAGAKIQIILWADLENLEKNDGSRAYRHALLAAGRAGQRIYLAATALELDCCGTGAFYDDELAALNGIPQRAAPLYVLACG
jgi:SagB-type dehydrogenase family enzyme